MKKTGYVGSVIPIRVKVAPTSELVKAKVVGASAELIQPSGILDLKTSLDQETGVISTLVGPGQYVREGVYTVFVKAVFDDGSDTSFPVELEVMPRLVGGPVAPHVEQAQQVSDMVKAVDKPADQQYIPYTHLKAIQAFDPSVGFSTRLSALFDLKYYHPEDLDDVKLKDDWRLTCFVPGTLVCSPEGASAIETTTSVITGKVEQASCSVLKNAYGATILKVKAHYLPPVCMTPEHPVLAIAQSWCRRKERYCSPTCCEWGKKVKDAHHPYTKCPLLATSKLEWVAAGTLTRGYAVVVPKWNDKRDRGEDSIAFGDVSYPASLALFKAVGLLVADGCSRLSKSDAAIDITVNREHAEAILDCKKVLQQAFGKEPYITDYPAKGAVRVSVSGKHFALWFKENIGKHPNRRIPGFVYRGTKEQIQAFIEGYALGDGWISGGYQKMKFSQEKMAFSVLQLALMVGQVYSWSKYPYKGNFVSRSGYSVELSRWLGKSEHSSYWEDDQYFYFPIDDVVEEKPSAEVVNLEVAGEEHTYLVPFVVHNCAWWCTLVPDEDTLRYPVDKVIDLATKIAKEMKKRGLHIAREYASADQQELYEVLRDRGVSLPDISAPGEDKITDFTGANEAQVVSKAEKFDDSEHRSAPAENPGPNISGTDELTKGNEANAGMHKHIIPGHPGFEAKEHPISQVHSDMPGTPAPTALPTRSRPSLGQVHKPAAKKYMQEHTDPGAHLDEMLKAFDEKVKDYDPVMRVSMFDGRKHLTTSMDDLACWNCPRVEQVASQLWCPLMGIVDPLQVCRFYGLPVFVLAIGDADDLKKSQISYEEESEHIRENKKTPEAQQPHKFKGAVWTHPNGHPRCLLCGDEQREGGMCSGADLKKAPEELICAVGSQAKPEQVTVHRGGKVFASHRWKGRAKRGQTHTPSGQLIPKHWTHVMITTRKNSALQAVGKDAAGRTQYLYSTERTAKKAAQKWNRLKAFGKVVSTLDQAIEKQARRSDEGLILDIIKHTGFRIGSDKDTKAKVKAYGVSTLLAKHVKVDGDKVEFTFIGKEGVRNHKVIRDQQIADGLAKRLAKAKTPDARIFNTTDDRVRQEFRALPRANSFLIKDWRTMIGTQAALAAMKKLPAPKNAAQFIKMRREVSKKVAKVLGNTPAVALKSYIAPEVFSPWLAKLAAQGIEIKKSEGGYSVDQNAEDTNRVGGYSYGSGALMKGEEEDDIGMPSSLAELFDVVDYDSDGSAWEHDPDTESDPDDDATSEEDTDA